MDEEANPPILEQENAVPNEEKPENPENPENTENRENSPNDELEEYEFADDDGDGRYDNFVIFYKDFKAQMLVQRRKYEVEKIERQNLEEELRRTRGSLANVESVLEMKTDEMAALKKELAEAVENGRVKDRVIQDYQTNKLASGSNGSTEMLLGELTIAKREIAESQATALNYSNQVLNLKERVKYEKDMKNEISLKWEQAIAENVEIMRQFKGMQAVSKRQESESSTVRMESQKLKDAIEFWKNLRSEQALEALKNNPDPPATREFLMIEMWRLNTRCQKSIPWAAAALSERFGSLERILNPANTPLQDPRPFLQPSSQPNMNRTCLEDWFPGWKNPPPSLFAPKKP